MRFFRNLLLTTLLLGTSLPLSADTRTLPLQVYQDKMKGGWLGQMIGVGWGAPTEFRYNGVLIPEEAVPQWTPETINQFAQDDIYVEMTFLHTLEKQLGKPLSIREAGIDFANSAYPLWHANRHGRDNLRKGIAPPDSGHPQFNQHADDIDYQIEADFAGLIAPGLPNEVIALGQVFGRLMNYGDGLYGGLFVGGMYAEAFFESDIPKIIQAGLACIPQGSQYHECISDVIRWHAAFPNDWTKAWEKVDEKYQRTPDYRRFCCSGTSDPFNIDAKINGAYIVLGLLYGDGDLEKTTIISMRCGLDSDCNPSNAAGIIGTILGAEALEARFTQALNQQERFCHTPYTFPALLATCEKLALDAVTRSGGAVSTGADGQTLLKIPRRPAQPPQLEQCWAPGPLAESRYTAEERARILKAPWIGADGSVNLDSIFAGSPFEGWQVRQCGQDMDPGFRGADDRPFPYLLTHPLDKETPCVLSRRMTITEDGPKTLRLTVLNFDRGDWVLKVYANQELLLEKQIDQTLTGGEWHTLDIDLSAFTGQSPLIELHNHPNDWFLEAAKWGEITLQ